MLQTPQYATICYCKTRSRALFYDCLENETQITANCTRTNPTVKSLIGGSAPHKFSQSTPKKTSLVPNT